MKRLIVLTLVSLLLTAGTASAAEIVNANLDVDGGTVTITATTYDHSTWHPGSIGGQETLVASGDFTGTYVVNEGNYGALRGFTNLAADSGADFDLFGMIDFDITSANHNPGVQTNYYFGAWGNNAEMNLKTVGSMYVWSEATNPYWEPALQGNYIEKHITSILKGTTVTLADTDLWVGTDGTATLSNSNIWGFGASESGLITSHYADPGSTRTVTSTGDGMYVQSAYGYDGVTFNGFTFGPGSLVSMGSTFSGGMTGTYQMKAW